MSVFYTNATPQSGGPNPGFDFPRKRYLVLSAFVTLSLGTGNFLEWYDDCTDAFGNPRSNCKLTVSIDGLLKYYYDNYQLTPDAFRFNIRHHIRVAITFGRRLDIIFGLPNGNFLFEIDGKPVMSLGFDAIGWNTYASECHLVGGCTAVQLFGDGADGRPGAQWTDLALGDDLSDLILFPPDVPANLRQAPSELLIGDEGPVNFEQAPAELLIADAGPVKFLQLPVEILYYDGCPCVPTYSSRIE